MQFCCFFYLTRLEKSSQFFLFFFIELWWRITLEFHIKNETRLEHAYKNKAEARKWCSAPLRVLHILKECSR